ncbi:hypothetical protein FRX31_002271 [Thalictrum thalictroides]|uniref:Uncharacterized protein n=1 Tax=Thalictrum thalictroides TaxID=46969 RepID=A0A7J6XHD0_THATH|nr:hypothetical protein FRX31_002271 [Thalictrum thalictroides]
MECNAKGSPNTKWIRNANEERMQQPVSQVISNSNQTTITPEISYLGTQIPSTSPDCIAASIKGNQGQLGVGVHATHAREDGNQGQKKKNEGEGSQGYSSNPTQTTTDHESVKVAQNLSVVRPELVNNQLGTINVFVHGNEDKANGKAIATQGQQQGGGNSNKIDGFMKDARRSDAPSKDGKGNAKGNVSQHTQQYKRRT